MSTFDKLVGATSEGVLPPAVLDHLPARETTALASGATVEHWVSPSGDDDADGSQAYPFRTIAHAVAQIPDVIRYGHTHTIKLLPGAWNEQLTVHSRTVLGTLIVEGTTEDRYAHTIRDAHTQNVQGHYIIRNIHSSKTVPGVHFRFNASGPRMEVWNCSGTGEVTDEPHSSGNQGVLADYGSRVLVEHSKFDYKDYALRANYVSTLMSRHNTGIGNTFGLGARFGGIIESYGTLPHGYENTTTFSSGGIVVHASGGHVGVQRWNQDLDKSDTHGLIEQLTLQGQGSISPTKQWVSRGTTTRQGEMPNSGGTIPDGSTLRIFFQLTTPGRATLSMDVAAVWLPIGFSGSRFTKAYFAPSIADTNLVSSTTFVLASAAGGGGATGETTLTLGHTGSDGIFYLDFYPNGGANNGQHGLDIRISNMFHQDAPIMLGAEVIA